MDEEGNESRIVTKMKWVVESANGRIKNWKAFRNTMSHSQIPYIGYYVRVVRSLYNALRYSTVISTESDSHCKKEKKG